MSNPGKKIWTHFHWYCAVYWPKWDSSRRQHTCPDVSYWNPSVCCLFLHYWMPCHA